MLSRLVIRRRQQIGHKARDSRCEQSRQARRLRPVDFAIDTSYIRSYTEIVAVNWDPHKAAQNVKDHKVRFADAVLVLQDPYAVTITDLESDLEEERYVTIGADALGRILVVVYTYRGDDIRVISARRAEAHERKQYKVQA